MNSNNLFFLGAFFFSMFSWASSPPQTLTYQGRLFQSNGITPIESATVTFRLQVLSADGACLLFEETHFRDMTSTAGIFSLVLGGGTNSGASSLSLAEALDNSTNRVGAASCAHTPGSGDFRRLRTTFFDGVDTVTLSPDQVLRSVPYALHSQTLQGLTKDKFIQSSNNITQSRVEGVFSNYTQLYELMTGTSNLYSKSTDLPISSGVLNLSSGGVRVNDTPASNDHAVNKNYADSKMGGKNLDLNGLANGQMIVWNAAQNKWQPSYMYTGTVTSITAGAGLWGGTITSTGTISLPTVGTAGTYSKITTDAYGRVTTGAALSIFDLKGTTNLAQFPNSCTTSQTLVYTAVTDSLVCSSIALSASQVSGLGGAASLSVGTTAGTVAAGNDSRITGALQSGTNASGDLSGTFANPTVVKINGVSIASTVPTNGQILKYNSMNSRWEPGLDNSNAGTVTSVAAGTGLTGGTITGSGTLAVDVGTAANKIVQMDSSGRYPAADGSQLTNVVATSIKGVSVSSATPTNGQVLKYNSTTLSWEPGTDSSNAGLVTAVTATAPLSISGTTAPVVSISSGSSSGQVLKWSGTAWTAATLNMSDLKGASATSQFPTTCSAAQTWGYSVVSDSYACTSISIASSQVSGLGSAAGLSVGTISGTLAAGDDSRITGALQSSTTASGDLTGTFGSPTVSKIKGVGISSTAPSNGQVLKYNSTTSQLEFSADASNAGTVTSVIAGTGLTGGTITSSGTVSVDAGTTANKIVQLDSLARLPAVDGSQLTNVAFKSRQFYSTAGPFTWVVPTGVTRIYVEAWGAGGGGSGGKISSPGGMGGGAGAYADWIQTVTPGSSINIVVGAGGTGGATNANGSNGGSTTFDSTIVNGGSGASITLPGVGGAAPTGTGILGIEGTTGHYGNVLTVQTSVVSVVGINVIGSSTIAGLGGSGGSAPKGGAGGPGSGSSATAGGTGPAPGGGGGGGGSSINTAGSAGGAGGSGRIVIWY